MFLVSEHVLAMCACFYDIHMCLTCGHVFGMWAYVLHEGMCLTDAFDMCHVFYMCHVFDRCV